MKHLGSGIGIALCLFSAVVFGDAWRGGSRTLWSAGALAVLAGALIVVADMCCRQRPVTATARLETTSCDVEAESPAPLLGDLLVRHGLVSPAGLSEALALQRGTTRRLGGVLIGIGPYHCRPAGPGHTGAARPGGTGARGAWLMRATSALAAAVPVGRALAERTAQKGKRVLP